MITDRVLIPQFDDPPNDMYIPLYDHTPPSYMKHNGGDLLAGDKGKTTPRSENAAASGGKRGVAVLTKKVSDWEDDM